MAEVRIIDDNNDVKVLNIHPQMEIDIEAFVIPCICGRVVLMDVAGNDAEGCHTCKEEHMKEIKDDPKQIKDWLESWAWDYNHPGYWHHTKPYGTIIVGEYVGFYMGDPDQDGNEAFMTVTYNEYEEKVSLLKAMNMIDDDDERHIRMAIRYEHLVSEQSDPSVWAIEGGELHCPDSMRIYHKHDERRFVVLPCVLLSDKPTEEWDADDHAYLNGLAEHIKLYLDNHFS